MKNHIKVSPLGKRGNLYEVEFKGKKYLLNKKNFENFRKDFYKLKEEYRRLVLEDLAMASALGIIVGYTDRYGRDPRRLNFESKIERLLVIYHRKTSKEIKITDYF